MDIKVGDQITLKPVTVIAINSGMIWFTLSRPQFKVDKVACGIDNIESVIKRPLQAGDIVRVKSFPTSKFVVIHSEARKTWVLSDADDLIVFTDECERL